MDDIWEAYGSWLIQHVGLKKRGYSKLFQRLHNTHFYYTHPMDSNRSVDGMCLRDVFLDEVDLHKNLISFPTSSMGDCSVLEMLVALAIRCDNEYIGDPKNPRPDQFFWQMCENLGLDRFKNAGFSKKKEAELDDILQNWMYRKHGSDGVGGLFPVKNPKNNHREIEIWKQMMEFLSENY